MNVNENKNTNKRRWKKNIYQGIIRHDIFYWLQLTIPAGNKQWNCFSHFVLNILNGWYGNNRPCILHSPTNVRDSFILLRQSCPLRPCHPSPYHLLFSMIHTSHYVNGVHCVLWCLMGNILCIKMCVKHLIWLQFIRNACLMPRALHNHFHS